MYTKLPSERVSASHWQKQEKLHSTASKFAKLSVPCLTLLPKALHDHKQTTKQSQSAQGPLRAHVEKTGHTFSFTAIISCLNVHNFCFPEPNFFFVCTGFELNLWQHAFGLNAAKCKTSQSQLEKFLSDTQ